MERIGTVFRRTRRNMGDRGLTQKQFAEEVLLGLIDPSMLSYIENGERLPSERIVRLLAMARREDPKRLLVILARERLLLALAPELERIITDETEPEDGIADPAMALAWSQALKELPEEGWMALRTWRAAVKKHAKACGQTAKGMAELLEQVEATLERQKLTERRGDRIRRKGSDFTARVLEERRALARKFADIFAKGLTDVLLLPDEETGTYVRNHFFDVEAERIPEFRDELHRVLTELRQRYESKPGPETEPMNVLTTATVR